jgi:hypothetical protein
MVLTGHVLLIVLIVLTLWLVLMLIASVLTIKNRSAQKGMAVRGRLTLAGMIFATLAVGSLLLLHLTWITPEISQRFGAMTIRLLATILFWSSLAGFLLTIIGSGKLRYLGTATCMIAGVWFLLLYVTAAISMSGTALARHAARFLIPDGYVGWVEVKYGVKDSPALVIENETFIYQIPSTGLLKTSSLLEYGWAKDEYFYYSENGSRRPLRDTGWGMGGYIWGESDQWQGNSNGSVPSEVSEFFYVGTEQQYHNAVSKNESRPFNEAATVRAHE